MLGVVCESTDVPTGTAESNRNTSVATNWFISHPTWTPKRWIRLDRLTDWSITDRQTCSSDPMASMTLSCPCCEPEKGLVTTCHSSTATTGYWRQTEQALWCTPHIIFQPSKDRWAFPLSGCCRVKVFLWIRIRAAQPVRQEQRHSSACFPEAFD